MDKDKYFFLTLIILNFIVALVSYIYKSFEILVVSFLIMLAFFLLMFLHLGRMYKVKIFQFLIGDFTLKDTIKVNKIIYGRQERWIYSIYINMSFIVAIFLLGFLNYFNSQSLIIPGISLISVGIALSLLTFNYSRVKDTKSKDNLILSSAKRFYLSTIFAIFLLISILVYRTIPSVTKSNFIFFSVYSFTDTYFQLVLAGITLIFITFFGINSLRFLLEGFILSIKETIIFDT